MADNLNEKMIEAEIELYFNRQVARVRTPPVPLESDQVYQTEKGEEIPADPFPFQRRSGLFLLRAASAAILILGGAALLPLSTSQNDMAKIIAQISEQENLEEKIISGLQKVGRFLYLNL
jgi:hypothetical protein